MKMKKKLAALLAVTMVLSPLTVFGATDNKTTKNPANITGKTLLMEEGYNRDMVNLDPIGAKTDDVEYVVDGNTVVITPSNETIKTGDMFKVILDNAEWFFRNANATEIGLEEDLVKVSAFILKDYKIKAVEITATGITKFEFESYEGSLPKSVVDELMGIIYKNSTSGTITATLALVDLTLTKGGSTIVAADLEVGKSYYLTTTGIPKLDAAAALGLKDPTLPAITDPLIIPAYTDKFSKTDLQDAVKKNLATYATNHRAATINQNFTGSGNTIATYDLSAGIYLPNAKTYIRLSPNGDKLDYYMTISSDNKTGTVTVMRDFVAGGGISDSIYIPLVSLSDKEGDIRVAIAPDGNITSVSKKDLQYGQATKNNTNTTVKTEITSKYNFPMDQLIIAEKVPNSLQAGGIVLEAPYGYTFVDPEKSYKDDGKDKWVTALGEESLFFKGNRTEAENTKATFGSFIRYGYDQDNKIMKNKIIIDTKMLGLINTGKTNGKLIIKGLQLTASDYASMDEDIKITIRDVDTDSKSEDGKDGALGKAYVSKQDVKIGTRKEWGVVLERIGDIPTLINGRYNEALKGTEFDKDHKAAKVRFTENVVASWWGLRESQFTLSEGAKWIQAKISEVKNIEDKIDGTIKPDKEQSNAHIKMDALKLKFVDVEIKKDKKSSFEIESWVSIESGVEGDIEMIAGGNDILTNETKPVVIAKAVSPVRIESKVTDVKIGYQWQKAHDVVIKENGPGYLKRDKTFFLLVDDNITGSDRIAFAPDFIVETNGTASKMEITKPIVNAGNIEFGIERISNGKAAEIKFSNVYVKIDRTVPESNKRPYNIVAGGTAVAANYYANQDKKKLDNYEPFFNTKGIGVEYLNVVTSANDKDSILSNVVRLEIGSNIVKIGRNGETEIEMDTAPYISPQTNSTMVPVRFVAIALGIAEDQISWDSVARKVTIVNGSRIVQFEIGSSEIIINGVSKTMYSPDIPPIKVVPEIKDDRAFLPFRELGNAFGVGDVHWDEAAQAAIYNYKLLNKPASAE